MEERKRLKVQVYQGWHHAAGSWGFVGQCAYCASLAPGPQSATHEVVQVDRRGRKKYTAICERHAKQIQDKSK